MLYPRDAIAIAGISCHHVSVCPSVTSRCSTKAAKRRITQTTPHDSAGSLVFWCQKSLQNSNGVTPNGGVKCRSGRLNAGAVAENWQLSTRSVVNLARSQVYHTERPPCRRSPDAARCAGLSATADTWWRPQRYQIFTVSSNSSFENHL